MAGAGGPASPILAYGGGMARTAGKDEAGNNNLIEYHIPIGLIAFGLLVAVLQNMRFSAVPLAFGAAMFAVIVATVVNLVLMLMACLIVVKLIDVSFGAPGPALLKLAAISLAPGAVAMTVQYFVPGSTGWFVSWTIALILYYCLFSYLFDLDGTEVMILAVVVWLIRTFATIFIVVALLSLVMGHAARRLGGGGFGGFGAHVSSADAETDELLQNTWKCIEARTWLNDSAGRIFGKETHQDSLKITDDLYDRGAARVTAVKDGSQAGKVVITLPKSKDDRQRLFNWHSQNMDKYGWVQEVDDGQKYLVLTFDTFMSSDERQEMLKKMKNSSTAQPNDTSNEPGD